MLGRRDVERGGEEPDVCMYLLYKYNTESSMSS